MMIWIGISQFHTELQPGYIFSSPKNSFTSSNLPIFKKELMKSVSTMTCILSPGTFDSPSCHRLYLNRRCVHLPHNPPLVQNLFHLLDIKRRNLIFFPERDRILSVQFTCDRYPRVLSSRVRIASQSPCQLLLNGTRDRACNLCCRVPPADVRGCDAAGYHIRYCVLHRIRFLDPAVPLKHHRKTQDRSNRIRKSPASDIGSAAVHRLKERVISSSVCACADAKPADERCGHVA